MVLATARFRWVDKSLFIDMKYLLIPIAILFSLPCFAQTALIWNANSTSDAVTNYAVLHAAPNSSTFTLLANVGTKTTLDLGSPVAGQKYFVVAQNVRGSSAPSLTATNPSPIALPAAPSGVKVITISIQ